MIRTAAVLGAGTMGAQIAGHLANAGLDVALFDLSSALAADGIARLAASHPPVLFTPEVANRIRPCALDDLRPVGTADWVIEAVIESMPAKRELIARLEPHVNASAIVSSNTSALSVREIAADRTETFRRRWLGTHFFNPPRYQALVEVVATADTDPAVVAALGGFLDRSLGKDVVAARDTPGFIANRIALYGAVRSIHLWASGEFTIEEIEAATGPAVGGPRSATFRTMDLVGIDVVAAIAADLARRLPGEGFELPEVVDRMLDRGLAGVKAGRGFYARASSGDRVFLALDPLTLNHRPVITVEPSFMPDSLPLPERLQDLLQRADRAGDLVRRTLGASLLHAAEVAPEIADSIDDIDRAMRSGFGWQAGPFELWDAIGVRGVLDTLRPARPPGVIQVAIEAGRWTLRDRPLPPAGPDLLLITSARRAGRVVRTTSGATLVDLDDGVFAVELHSKHNVLGGDAIDMLEAGIAHAAAQGLALVVTSESGPFSAGADLRVVLTESRAGRWAELEALVARFQTAMMLVKTAPIPVVAAPIGLALGGGCELCLHADRIEAAAETYLGLPETSVGLIPAGGGTKEMLLRAGKDTDPAGAVARAFRTIASARVSTSARDAARLGFLSAEDGITMHRQRVTASARRTALARVEEFQARAMLDAIPVGGRRLHDALAASIDQVRSTGQISDHDALVGRKLALVFAGGPDRTVVSERQLLDLERDAFLSLCGEPKTLERIAYTLKTGKPLRN